jgi:hypothetical protein
VTVSIPNVRGQAGGIVVVPINIDDAAGVAGADITLTFNANILTVIEVKTTLLTEGFTLIDSPLDGKIVISTASAKAIGSGDGAFTEVTFQVAKDASGNSFLHLEKVSLFDKTAANIPANTQDGYFVVEPVGGVKRTLSVSSASGKPGSVVIVYVNISDATGVAGGDIMLNYAQILVTSAT